MAQVAATSSGTVEQEALSTETLMVNELIDMEWKFGITASTESVDHAGHSFLQLKLVLDKGQKTEIVNMELSLSQFYAFLQEMEKAQAALHSLKK
eukprot:CAMPEP_0201547374 /NCGR_PEP_ID=MMETSP0173_2-20130828/3856_1 /ASSEMBLY_ACC=CAM_ASM_000268 /TAXON_ID=218659 /ORGANISM="Vexillifera sp., Strain DIVA3 564/2" /LENGTH=94 /DNA_ID=CAMNT_0047956403 /DNA_START=19 /DNA_END=303 /DNA_ORIENTATION=-